MFSGFGQGLSRLRLSMLPTTRAEAHASTIQKFHTRAKYSVPIARDAVRRTVEQRFSPSETTNDCA